MTAIISFRRKASIDIYTDGACYNAANGSLLYEVQKAEIFLHQPSLLATRGDHFIGSLLKISIGDVQSFDDVVDNMAAHLRAAGAAMFGKIGTDDINLAAVFGGWSERSQDFELYRTWIGGDSPDKLDDGALELEKVAGYKIEPLPDMDLLAERGIFKDGRLDLSNNARIIELMQCLRERPQFFDRGPSEQGCIVGSFIQKTVLTRTTATAEIIHRWPDKIGEKLGIHDIKKEER